MRKPNLRLCNASAPMSGIADLTATLINLPRFRTENHNFTAFTTKYPRQQDRAMIEDLHREGWRWTAPQTDECHVIHNPAYTSCRTSGNFWIDSPKLEEMGCYSDTSFKEKFGWGYHRFDLQHFREDGFCLSYTKEEYEKHVNAGLASTGEA
jgi:hypothetical protein